MKCKPIISENVRDVNWKWKDLREFRNWLISNEWGLYNLSILVWISFVRECVVFCIIQFCFVYWVIFQICTPKKKKNEMQATSFCNNSFIATHLSSRIFHLLNHAIVITMPFPQTYNCLLVPNIQWEGRLLLWRGDAYPNRWNFRDRWASILEKWWSNWLELEVPTLLA